MGDSRVAEPRSGRGELQDSAERLMGRLDCSGGCVGEAADGGSWLWLWSLPFGGLSAGCGA